MVKQGVPREAAVRARKLLSPHIAKWKKIHDGVLENLLAIGVDRDVALRARAGFSDAWGDATHVKEAVESLAKGRDAKGAVFDTLFALDHMDESMQWLIEHAALAYCEAYDERWRSRPDQIDFVLESLKDWELGGGLEPLAGAIVDARIRARATAELFSELGLTGLGMNLTPRGALTKMRKQLEAFDESSKALRQAIATAQPPGKRHDKRAR